VQCQLRGFSFTLQLQPVTKQRLTSDALLQILEVPACSTASSLQSSFQSSLQHYAKMGVKIFTCGRLLLLPLLCCPLLYADGLLC
jgi:hypothetical protein